MSSKITKTLDANIKIAIDLKIELDYFSMSQTLSDALTTNILEAAGMEDGEIEFEKVKTYRGVPIRIHPVECLKVTFKL
jgi:hypothetical protein